MIADIYIRTYHKDFEILCYCLKSIKKYSPTELKYEKKIHLIVYFFVADRFRNKKIYLKPGFLRAINNPLNPFRPFILYKSAFISLFKNIFDILIHFPFHHIFFCNFYIIMLLLNKFPCSSAN